MSLSLTEAAAIGRRLSQVTGKKPEPQNHAGLHEQLRAIDRRLARVENDMLDLHRQSDRIERLLVDLKVSGATVHQIRQDTGCTLEDLIEWIGLKFRIRAKAIVSKSRQCQIAWARQVASWIANTEMGLERSMVASAFGCDKDTVSYSRRLVESEISVASARGKEALRLKDEWIALMRSAQTKEQT